MAVLTPGRNTKTSKMSFYDEELAFQNCKKKKKIHA